MNKYKIGDKLVIRKDLELGEFYGSCYWHDDDEFMKNYDYVVIDEVDEDGDYWIKDCDTFISEEMIAGLYE